MARAGSFGRRPRLGGNVGVANTIASLMRQMENSEWSAIQDAWKNGGTYDFGDGKGPQKVTDALLLAYMTKRRNDLDPSDPDYAQWNNALQQTQFNIGESKMGLRFKQGKISAATMAAWYRSQLKNYPRDSEVWRTIATRAADWASSVRAGGQAAAKAKAVKALQARVNADQATINGFAVMEGDLHDAAVRAGLITANQKLSDIRDTGTWTAMLHAGINTSHGVITMTDWTNALTSTRAAYGDQAAAYQANGQADDASKLINTQTAFTNAYIVPNNGLSIEARYHYAMDNYDTEMTQAGNDPQAQQAAIDHLKTSLAGVQAAAHATSNDPLQGEIPPEMVAGIDNTVNALDGKDTGQTWDATLGGAQPTADILDHVKNADGWNKAIANGSAIMLQTAGRPAAPVWVSELKWTPDANGVPHPPDDSYQVSTKTVNGVTSQVWYKGTAVYKADGSIAGYVFNDQDNKAVQYATVTGKNADGSAQLTFTTSDPFSNVATQTYTQKNGQQETIQTADVGTVSTNPTVPGAIQGYSSFASSEASSADPQVHRPSNFDTMTQKWQSQISQADAMQQSLPTVGPPLATLAGAPQTQLRQSQADQYTASRWAGQGLAAAAQLRNSLLTPPTLAKAPVAAPVAAPTITLPGVNAPKVDPAPTITLPGVNAPSVNPAPTITLKGVNA